MKNQMKAPLLARGVFREGLRRLRLTTVLITVLLTLSALVTPIVSVIEKTSDPYFKMSELTAVTVDAFEHHAAFLALFALAAPLVALTLFSFLTVRRESDFYHALPYTRTCLYLSLAASAAVSLLFMILVPTLLSALVYTLLSKFFYLSLAKLFLFSFGCFVGALSVFAACTLALSLTGTRLSAMAVTGMILFLPRFVIAMMTATLEGALPMVTAGHVAPFFDSAASYVFGFVYYLFPFFGVPTSAPAELAYSLPAMLYTLVLTVLYFALALLAFRRRPSETAERPAPNRRLQAVFRCAFGLFCSLFACSMLFMTVVEGTAADSVIGLIISYFSVLVAFCLYELITTRRAKALLRAIPSFLIVLLLNAALLLTMGGIYRQKLAFTPDKDEIKSVSLAADPYAEEANELTFYEYMAVKNSSLSLTDEASRASVSRALADCVKTYREKKTVYDYERYYEIGLDGEESYDRVNLAIRTKSGTHYRTVYLPRTDAAHLFAEIAENAEYKAALSSPPAPIKNTLAVAASGNTESFRGKRADELFALFSEEMAALSDEDKTKWWQPNADVGESNFYFYYSVEIGTKSVRLTLFVPQDYFPRTNERFLAMIAEEQASEGRAEAVRNALAKDEIADCYDLHFTVHQADGETAWAYFSSKDGLEKLRRAYDMIDFRAPKAGEHTVILTAYFWDESVIDESLVYRDHLLVGTVPDEHFEEFAELLGLQK